MSEEEFRGKLARYHRRSLDQATASRRKLT